MLLVLHCCQRRRAACALEPVFVVFLKLFSNVIILNVFFTIVERDAAGNALMPVNVKVNIPKRFTAKSNVFFNSKRFLVVGRRSAIVGFNCVRSSCVSFEELHLACRLSIVSSHACINQYIFFLFSCCSYLTIFNRIGMIHRKP